MLVIHDKLKWLEVFKKKDLTMRALLELPIRMQLMALLVFSVVSSAALLQWWNFKTFYSAELSRVADKHLVIADNLSLALSRYSQDLKNTFALASRELLQEGELNELTETLLAGLEVARLDIIASEPAQNTTQVLDTSFNNHGPEWSQLFKHVDENADLGGGIFLTPLLQIGEHRAFLLFRELTDEQVVIATVSVDYLKKVQDAISFGTLGHSAIFDQTGVTIAHPVSAMETKMINASGVPIVAAMLAGRTGVMEFYAPPMKADMIAGHTFVPETGWAVMVPQPISEISEQVNATLRQSYIWSGSVTVFVVALGWLLASRLVQPIKHLASVASAVAREGQAAVVDTNSIMPRELKVLNQSMAQMVERIHYAQQQLRDAVRIKTEESEKKTQFLLIAGHELRTPLNGILGMLQIVKSEETDPDKTEMLEAAFSSAEHLQGLTNNMMSFAQSETANEGPAAPDVIDFAVESRGLLRSVQEHSKSSGSEMTMNIQHGPSTAKVEVDWTRVCQIIWNLSDNAMKYASEAPWSIDLKLNYQKQCIELTVRDRGEGMSAEVLSQIWQPYYQANSTGHNRSSAGLGLGLSVVKTAVEQLDGNIEIDSHIGQGTVVNVTVPVTIVTH